MELPRRKFVQLAGAVVAASAFSRVATAQTYPTHPITMIVPFAPGGPSDAIARVLAERMRRSLGQPIVIENMSGANGSIGTGRLARERPDGYTIDLGNSYTHGLNGAFYSLPYDVLTDFEPILPLVASPVVLFARKTMPAKDLNELIAWLKANPNKASAGTVVVPLSNTLFQRETGTHYVLVPYRGIAPAIQDLVAGQIDLFFSLPVQALPLMRAESIRAYAVAGDARLTLAPDIPTFGEMGLPAVSWTGWFGLFAPKGTPRDVIDKLNMAAVEALADSAVRSRLVELGLQVFPREQQTPEALGTLVRANAEKWLPLVREFGISAE